MTDPTPPPDENDPLSDPLMSTVSVAEMFDVTPYTVRQWIREERIAAVKVNRSWRIKRSVAVAFANARYPS